MFRKFLEFLKKIFNKRQNLKMLEEKCETCDNTVSFKKMVQFDGGKRGKELLQEIINEKDSEIPKTLEELRDIQEKLVEYIDVLIKQIDKCQTDIAIKKLELSKLGNEN